jgi:DNA-binding CsgD family transcriptional regulator
MKEIRAELRLRNNRLYNAIFPRWDSVQSFCKEVGLHATEVGELLNLKKSPRISTGYRACCTRMSEFFKVLPEDLFPEKIYTLVETSSVREFNTEQILRLSGRETTEDDHDRALLVSDVTKALNTLPEREREIIRLRFYEDQSLAQVAKVFGITRERIRMLEARGLRMLRLPNRSTSLKIWNEAR